MTYPNSPGFKDGDTSRLAAIATESRAETLRSKCLAHLSRSESTADETAKALGVNILSIRPRIAELKRKGEIRDTGKRRPNTSGHSAKVWTASNS